MKPPAASDGMVVYDERAVSGKPLDIPFARLPWLAQEGNSVEFENQIRALETR